MIMDNITKYVYTWHGFLPSLLFIFGKYAKFFDYSWWWILIPIALWTRKKKFVCGYDHINS